jgi:hypothetical protein
MNDAEIKDLLQRLRLGFQQSNVTLKCDCDNLETVYVSLGEDGKVIVSDRGESIAYLSRGTDSTYRPLADSDFERVAEICQRLGVSLVNDDSEGYPRIECERAFDESVTEAIPRVADAVDQLFQFALRDRSGWSDNESGSNDH